jgi:RNA-directed DNA polymerase
VKFPWATHLVVTADSVDPLLKAKEIISIFLEQRGLSLSDEKTTITHISTGFDFLGWNFRKYDGTLLAKPSKNSQKSITQKIREVIHQGRTWSQDRLIGTLNPIIRGWSLYHKHAVSSDVFSRLDHTLWCMHMRGLNDVTKTKVRHGFSIDIGIRLRIRLDVCDRQTHTRIFFQHQN